MNTIVRCLTEWTATNVQGILDQTSIAEGIGGYVLDSDGDSPPNFGFVNSRQKYIQGTSGNIIQTTVKNFSAGVEIPSAGDTTAGGVPGGASTSGVFSTKRYQVNLPFGLMTQDKVSLLAF